MVASPTPTAPIAVDSMTSMQQPPRVELAKAAAAIQPADPPPMMTMRRIRRSVSLMTRVSGNQQLSERGARRFRTRPYDDVYAVCGRDGHSAHAELTDRRTIDSRGARHFNTQPR